MTIVMCSHRAALQLYNYIIPGEFGIVYKGYLAGQYTDEIVAIKTLKGTCINNIYCTLQ